MPFAQDNVPTGGGKQDDYTKDEVEDMDKLILTLSRESNDEVRRQKIKEMFDEELAKPNGGPQRFTELFDSVLIIVGERVQGEARKRALEAQAQLTASPAAASTDDKTAEEKSDYTTAGKSPDELQLWALVDMMVQTKTIVKKANGRLGNEGTFS
eukprot:CAMPEP_0194049202 /NCGR_PEP_ID=MMETSP0009_2-20130614/29998_1 /TAXON_ID=210454 /ORGANISM="Grammatophora oceanica, Strain CCMP 410" /LENGTH=154 /DNA_ID=CAMNT_0038695297 /DNA_START=220 /DNA_END=685 /DNA_ORIENTATION=-